MGEWEKEREREGERLGERDCGREKIGKERMEGWEGERYWKREGLRRNGGV